tara:strand:- start:875 stop:1741 length:867 start_codon:yes stop_codon:yes gene_type:complete
MNTQQGTPAWFNARKGKLTASRFGAAAGICPYTSRAKALRLELGKEEAKWAPVAVEACTWGTKNEKNAIKDYMVRTGNVVTSHGFFEHPDYNWLGGSPDGLVGEEGMIEVKCPFVNKVCHNKIPPVYYCQVNGLMEILDRKWCDFVSWTPTEMKIYRVYKDSDLFNFLFDRYTLFYACMKRGCDNLPRVSKQEKQQVLQRISDSDDRTRYDFWAYLEPGAQQGRWEGPFTDPFAQYSSDEEQEVPSSKRPLDSDGTADVRKLQSCGQGIREELSTDPSRAQSRLLHRE